MGHWLELRVSVDGEAAEAVAELLSRCTGRGIAIEQVLAGEPQFEGTAGGVLLAGGGPLAVVGYLLASEEAEGPLRQAREGLWHLHQLWPGVGTLAVRVIEEEDWATAWREHFHVTRVGRRCVIVPTWREHTPAPEEVVIALDPGLAFGTGLHPSTRLCLRGLEDYTLPSMEALDLGTGSGILSIAAAQLGARRVLALDTDPVAVRAARENAARNGLAAVISVQPGSLELAPVGSFHLVVANLTAQLLLDLARPLLGALRPGGIAIVSGFLEERQPEVAAAIQQAGGNVRAALAEEGWSALVVRRRGDRP